MDNKTGNFYFLSEHDDLFVELAGADEKAFASDHNTTLIKLRSLIILTTKLFLY